MEILPNLPLILSGALTGFAIGLTGIGGGAIMTPILLLFFGIAPATAIGTDLWFAAITKLFAGKVHQKEGLIDWIVVKRLWWGSLPMTTITILMMKYDWIHINSTSLKTLIALMILITAVGIIFQNQIKAFGKSYRIQGKQEFQKIQPPLTVLAGALLGFTVSLTSIGAGALGAVLLTYLYPLRLTPSRLIATDIIHAIPLAMFAGLGHLFIGHVDFELLLFLLSGSIPLVYLGAKLSSKLPSAILRLALSFILMVVAIKIVLSS